jgi:ribosomal protein L3 glutamine methyltransferase
MISAVSFFRRSTIAIKSNNFIDKKKLLRISSIHFTTGASNNNTYDASKPLSLAIIQETSKLSTIHDHFRYAVTQFSGSDLSYGHFTHNAVEEATFLLLQSLRLPIAEGIECWFNCRLTVSEKNDIIGLIHRRIDSRIPLAYLLSAAYQQGELFYVDKRVLIPRSFIGDILMSLTSDGYNFSEMDYGKLIDSSSVHSVLDLCTGSGCLAVLAARVFHEG